MQRQRNKISVIVNAASALVIIIVDLTNKKRMSVLSSKNPRPYIPDMVADEFPVSLVRCSSSAGNSNIRNPILVSYVAKGLLPYHGLGSGIKRALEKWPAIDFTDDHDGCLFTATVHRKPVEELDLADKGALKVQIKEQPAPIKASLSALQVQLLDFIRSNPAVSYDELAEMTQKDRTTVMRNIGKLKDAGILRRVGSKKTGHWEVLE